MATVPAAAPPHSVHPYISPKPIFTFQVTKWAKEFKDLVLSDESFDELISWYEHLQQSMAIATGRHDVIPEIESLHHNFSFRDYILSSPSSSVYKAAVLEYVSMARSLRIYLSKSSTISTSCGIILEKTGSQ